MRAYVLTNDDRFLEPFYEGRDLARTLEAQLKQLVADNQEQEQRKERAVAAHHRWSLWADQAIRMVRVGGDAGNLEFQLRGKTLMVNQALDAARARMAEVRDPKEWFRATLSSRVSRSIVEKHGGSIRIERRSNGRQGTTVSIFVPRKTRS